MLQARKKKGKDPFDYSILIVCEDSKSSVYYFEAKVKEAEVSTSITIEKALRKGAVQKEGVIDVDGNSDASPTSVVDYAIQRRDAYNKEAKRKGMFSYKDVYCVMDVDNHNDNDRNLDRAIELIEEDKVQLEKKGIGYGHLIPIISNECIELWYVLHFIEYSTKALHRPRKEYQFKDDERLDKILTKYLGEDYAKGDEDIFNKIVEAKGEEVKAINSAKKLEGFHKENTGEELAYYDTPFTKVYFLIEELNRLKERNEADFEDYGTITIEQILEEAAENEAYQTFRAKLNHPFIEKLIDAINSCFPKDTLKWKISFLFDLLLNPWIQNISRKECSYFSDSFYSDYQSWENE